MYIQTVAVLSVLLPAIVLAQSKVNVTVYYESLCPDSQRFINNQLTEAYKTPLAMFMTLVLVPYGNANTTATGISCQHGIVECYGNKIQACAIEKISMQEKQMGFINCLMKMAYEKKPANISDYNDFVKNCSTNWTDQSAAIETCANSPDADQLMYKYGNMTKNAKPAIKGVPTIFFDGKSNDEINTAASKNFSMELCKYISGTKPHECDSGKGGSSELIGSILLVISATILSRFH